MCIVYCPLIFLHVHLYISFFLSFSLPPSLPSLGEPIVFYSIQFFTNMDYVVIILQSLISVSLHYTMQHVHTHTLMNKILFSFTEVILEYCKNIADVLPWLQFCEY